MDNEQERFWTMVSSNIFSVEGCFLSGPSLELYLRRRELSSPVNISVPEPGFNVLCQRLQRYNFSVSVDTNGTAYADIFDNRIIITCMHRISDSDYRDSNTGKTINPIVLYATRHTIEENQGRAPKMADDGLWLNRIDMKYPFFIKLPYRYGSYLDIINPLWWKDGGDQNYDWDGKLFFDDRRKKVAYELLSLIHERGKRAGIDHAMWLGFGGMLGYVREGDLIRKDNDLDICIDSTKTDKESDLKYIEEIKVPFDIDNSFDDGCKRSFPHGLCESRFQAPSFRWDTDRPLWTSIGHRNISTDYGVKACHWWWFEHSDFMWHSKGGRWINPSKFAHSIYQYKDSSDALALGIPNEYIKTFEKVNFKGIDIRFPTLAGHCLDWWYPNWGDIYGDGSSAKKIVLCVDKWENKKTWGIIKA